MNELRITQHGEVYRIETDERIGSIVSGVYYPNEYNTDIDLNLNELKQIIKWIEKS